MSTTAERTFEAYRDATERRDADAVLQLFTEDAVLVEYDKEHPPSSPDELRGKARIEEMLRDVYGRDMTHKVEGQVIGEDRFSFIERCEYPDGNPWSRRGCASSATGRSSARRCCRPGTGNAAASRLSLRARQSGPSGHQDAARPHEDGRVGPRVPGRPREPHARSFRSLPL